jgi:hypothetical protein
MNKSEIINTVYYKLKPLIPRGIQIWLRRKAILRKKLLYQDVWPIDEKASKPPERWLGWPQGKRFALVLTHDVDTAKGQEKCCQLIELEQSLGFKSSFNFVPKRYEVSSELRKYLVSNGFEVGIHGLYHDGRLYKSRQIFEQRAKEINHYLHEWNSVGFRSPSMQHNLDWIHDLNIEYDASTFDTDPFEPQPDGVGTIFPFWVPRNSSPCSSLLAPCSVSSGVQPSSSNLESPRSSRLSPRIASANGFIELPYTLPQDFTLFILMKEKNINIWKKKLDWLATKGGMALLNTHPDYMNFDGKKLGVEEYPAKYYKEFLEYVRSKYEGQYWHIFPKGMARFWLENSH